MTYQDKEVGMAVLKTGPVSGHLECQTVIIIFIIIFLIDLSMVLMERNNKVPNLWLK